MISHTSLDRNVACTSLQPRWPFLSWLRGNLLLPAASGIRPFTQMLCAPYVQALWGQGPGWRGTASLPVLVVFINSKTSRASEYRAYSLLLGINCIGTMPLLGCLFYTLLYLFGTCPQTHSLDHHPQFSLF